MVSPTAPTISSTGITAPSFADILTWLQGEYRTIYGADVYLESDSQDGQFLAILAAAINDTNSATVAVYNSFSPATSQGQSLSSNVKINGIARLVATNSTADVILVGVAGTVITNGILGPDAAGHKWNLPASVTIPLSGSITVTATCQDLGAVSAAPNTIIKMATPVFGWQSVTNPAAAAIGNPVETDAELRIRQSLSVALGSLSVFEGIIGAVAILTGVTRLCGYENDSDVVDADGIPAHSISIIVEGGDSQSVGDAIARKKTPGTSTFGTTPITTYDRYGIPNVINFFRPTNAVIGVEVTIQPLTGYTSDNPSLIKTAVAEVLNLLAIGEDVLLTKLYMPANLYGQAAGATFDITLLRIKKNAGVFGTANLIVGFNEVAFCNPLTDVTVIVL